MSTMTLAIDPSVNSLGWAIFYNNHLHKYGTVKGGKVKHLTHEKRLEYIIDRLYVDSLATQDIRCDYIVVEKPKLWGATKSVASQHSGSLLGLHILVGAIYWWGRDHCQKEARMIPVSDWKGQLPKRVTTKRMEARYNCTFANLDEADAVGIGDYFVNKCLTEQGELK